ncbi:MAG: DUF4124 domain-containing protein [Xanthomonadales bacterium]|nr:DUF4124 domain-containing protein [Xanthomonadales bacterium]
MTGWLLAVLLSAPGDIFRCVSDEGSVHFQDQPCPGEQAAALRSGGGSLSEARLREWLRKQGAAPQAPSTRNRAVSGHRPQSSGGDRRVNLGPLPAIPAGEAALASCSQRFLVCADGDDVRMDRCIAGVPRCEEGAVAECCAGGFLERYQLLRQRSVSGPAAVRYALLGTD